ncbi:hypothetical protein ABXS69_09800 [Actinomyces timonensis]|uniref:Uncharacterized protein n=1 Tax=Actinomyces timonensis TaxID=1288391 RepID=A0AAU8N498_9ACTO
MSAYRPLRALAALAACVPMSLAFLPVAAPAAAAEAPAAAAAADASGRLQSNHTADPLPTVQINGVVWDQVIVDDTVYAVGSFTKARPAGVPAGTNETVRSNILAYKLSTGELIQEFAPQLNGTGRVLALSEDKKTLYVGGDFNKVNDEFHSGLAAFDISTPAGRLISRFRPQFQTTVRAIGVRGDTVYAGGAFKHVNGVQRLKAAAVSASTGETLSWAPKAEGNNAQVWSLQVSPDGTKVALGGSFTTLNGSNNPGYGLGLVSASDGQLLSTPINSEVRNGGVYGAITDLKTDGTSLYGVGYSFSVRNANLEGAFKADWNGNMTWVEPCHGDSYAIHPTADQVYIASHAHSCQTIGGWADSYYKDEHGTTRQRQYRLTSFTASGEVTVGRKGTDGYKDWSGKTSPAIVDWFPELLRRHLHRPGPGRLGRHRQRRVHRRRGRVPRRRRQAPAGARPLPQARRHQEPRPRGEGLRPRPARLQPRRRRSRRHLHPHLGPRRLHPHLLALPR